MLNNKSLSGLPDSVLINQLDMLVRKEREITIKLLLHLIEMDRRGLYAAIGYSSLFEYCTRHLGYSEAAANRRIRTARCIRDNPEVYDMLAKNELNLTTVSRLAGVMNDYNKAALLKEARHASTRQIETIIARFNPKRLIPDRVKTVYLKSAVYKETARVDTDIKTNLSPAPVLAKATNSTLSNPRYNCVKFTTGAGGKKLATSENAPAILEKKFKLEFAVSPEVMAKIEKVKALLSAKFPKGMPLEQLLDAVLDEFIEKHDPTCRESRRLKRKEKNSGVVRTKCKSKLAVSAEKTTPLNRHIPAAIRDRVYARDNGRCSYVSPAGIKCNSKWNLEIDHIVPFARGGDHSVDNLRLLCARHNRLAAENVYGREYIKNKMPGTTRPHRE